METLQQLFQQKGYSHYPTDKDTNHSYLETYDILFNSFQNKPINLLEVGIWKGGSIRLWNEYFENATIFGYDITDIIEPEMFTKKSVKIIRDFKTIRIDEFESTPLYIAIDDGSHTLQDQLDFVKLIYPQLSANGILIIEDIQNIDGQKISFDSLGIPYEIIDLRSVKGRYDDVLLIFKKL